MRFSFKLTLVSGLGNASRNSIYSCQLGRIQHYVNNLFTNDDGPIPFWLDTICVPKERESRRQAILDMKDVYAGATKVLVLDKLLFTTPIETSVHEKLMRITASVWTTRLWTLHEVSEKRILISLCSPEFSRF